MTTSGKQPPSEPGEPEGAPASYYDPERHPWPPNAAQVRLYVLFLLLLGVPLAWWAVNR